jgi:hypothetical protein
MSTMSTNLLDMEGQDGPAHGPGVETMTNLTSLEAIVLNAFGAYKTAEDTKSDLGVSWTDATDLAADTGLQVNTVKGVLGSLVKKGLVYADDEPGKPAAVCLTEDGVDAKFALPADLSEAPVVGEEGPELEATDAEAAFIAALIKAGADEEVARQMGNPYPGIICSTLRAFAVTWEGSRKSFIATAQRAGFNPRTAATQWQRGRNRG